MKVKSLHWISEDAKEAELIVHDGYFECLVFSHPCNLSEGDILNEPLHPLEIEDLIKSLSNKPKIEKLSKSYFAYKFVAKIINVTEAITAIGGITIDLGINIPSWAKDGDYIEFNCSRLDVW
jgi:hypothetical protein